MDFEASLYWSCRRGLLVFDPVQTAWMLRCPTRQWFGLSCPLCGAQRAVHAVLHGQWQLTRTSNRLLPPVGVGCAPVCGGHIMSPHIVGTNGSLLCAPGSFMPFCGSLCAIFSVVDARPDEARTIIFFTPPTAHQRYSGRGNCYH